MRSSRRSCARSLLPIALLALSPAVAAPEETRLPLVELSAPPCTIVHPASLSREAGLAAAALPSILDRLSRRLEAPPLPACRFYLVTQAELSDEDVEDASSAMPDWAAGIALPDIGTVVIRADRVGSWRQRELTGVLAHEAAHLLMAAAAGEGADRMPGWFREGVAANLARDGEWLDFFYLWVSPIPSSERPLSELEGFFRAEDQPVLVKAAYSGAFSFLRFVMAKHSSALPAGVLRGLRRGLDFENAWSEAADGPLSRDEREWSEQVRGGTRWAAIITSSATLWLAITLMVLLAWLLKRRRSARVLERWSEEDPYG
ncbi:MAG TPA: hypothetical protein VGK94_02100 [Candidatus Polarisedimenticolia bacterium]|jgi:hypothetical protein